MGRIDTDAMSDNNIVKIIPAKTDAEYAADIKVRAIECWKPLLVLMEEAHKNGFRIIINAGLNELGQAFIHNMEVQKVYK